MPALISCERVITFRVLVPPPLHPQIPKRLGSTHCCCFSHLIPSTRSFVSEAEGFSNNVSSSFLLMAVAARLSITATTKPFAARTLFQRVSRCHELLTLGADGPP